MVVIECLKSRYNQGVMPDLYYYRDSNGLEVDVIFKDGPELVAIEIKSASTFSSTQLKGLKKFKQIASNVKKSYLIYNSKPMSLSDDIAVIHYKNTADIFIDS